MKFNPDGTKDNGFNSSTGLIEITATAGDAALTAITRAADGDFIAVGYDHNGSRYLGLIIKFSPDGTLDSNFSADGIQTFDAGGSTTDKQFFGVTIGAQGTIFVSGLDSADALIVAYDYTGALDSGLNAQGYAQYDLGNVIDYSEVFVDIKTDNFGGLMVLAHNAGLFGIRRYDESGNLISDYNDFRTMGEVHRVTDFAIDSLGNVYITGYFQDTDQVYKFVTIRYQSAVGEF
jgi:hypothetical protein